MKSIVQKSPALRAADAIVAHHDMRQRKHDCPGYDCVVCSLHADEAVMADIIERETGYHDLFKALETIVRNQGIGAAAIAELAIKQITEAL